ARLQQVERYQQRIRSKRPPFSSQRAPMRIHRDSFDTGIGMFNAERTQSNPKNGADGPDIENKVNIPWQTDRSFQKRKTMTTKFTISRLVSPGTQN
ncbi:unnamed protein product, partial [Heterotrigona itama]